MEKSTIADLITICLCILCLVCAFDIYIFFRSSSIPIVYWFERNEVVSYYSSHPFIQLPNWVLYSLPDGLWLLSYEFIITYLWKYQIKNKLYLSFTIGLPLFACSCELFQINGIIKGTFDILDLICYIFACLIGLSYCYYIKTKIYGKEIN